MKKRSVTISGHRTSLSLEEEFWTALKAEAKAQNRTLAALISEIDDARVAHKMPHNLSSALRLYILETLQARLTATSPSTRY